MVIVVFAVVVVGIVVVRYNSINELIYKNSLWPIK